MTKVKDERLTRDEIKAINERAGKNRHVQFFFKKVGHKSKEIICTRAVIRDQKWFHDQKVDR